LLKTQPVEGPWPTLNTATDTLISAPPICAL